MANSGENLSVLFRSLGPDDESFHMAENELAKKGEQKWPLFKTISLKRPEPTPELSAQERQCWNRQERSVVEERKPALSLPAFSKKLTISLDKITKQVELGAVQASFSRKQASMQSMPPSVTLMSRINVNQILLIHQISRQRSARQYSAHQRQSSASASVF